MTRSSVYLALCLLAATAPLALADPPAAGAPPAALEDPAVLVLEDGRVLPLVPGVTPPPEDLARVRHAWTWSESLPPRRMAVEDLGRSSGNGDEDTGTASRLRISMPRPPRDRDLPREVIAAPAEMWEEVPESLLPSFSLPAERESVSVPTDPGVPWRVRARAPGRGSWWADVAADAPTVTVATVPAPDLALEVADREGGPVPESRISVLAGHAERGDLHKLADYRTGEDGRVLIPSLPDHAEVIFLVSAPGHAPTSFQGLPSDLAGRLVVQPGTVVRGRFVSEEGLPVQGVRVRARSWVTPDLPIPISRWQVSAPDGSWEFPPLPRLRAELSAHAPERSPWTRVLELDEEAVELGEIVLEPAHPVRVTVMDDAGEPVAGASVEVAGRFSGTFTDDEGRAWIDVPPERLFEVRVGAPRHLSATVQRVPPLPEEMRVELVRAVVVVGRFVDAGGAGVVEGQARIFHGNRARTVELGDGGMIDLELEPGERYRVLLQSPRTGTREITVEPGFPGEIRDLGEVTAPPGLTVSGRLLRSDTAEPVAGARIWTPRPSAEGPLVAWVMNDLLEARSDVEGRFELTGLPPVPATVRIEAVGLARHHVPVVPEPGSRRVDLGDVDLGEGVELTVRLVEETEVEPPAAGESFAVIDLGGRAVGGDRLRAPVEDGVARIAHVPPGEVMAAVFRGEDLLCEVTTTLAPEQGAAEVDCHAQGLPVEGRVEVGGHPAGPGVLSWSVPTRDGEAAVILNFGSGPLRQQQSFSPRRRAVRVEVDDDGRFSTGHLRPGRWEVVWMPYTGASMGPVEVEIPVADAFDAVLRYPGLALAGVVVDGQGRPVEEARVRTLAGGLAARTGAGGTFVLAGLEPGLHRLQARTLDRASPVVEVTLEADRRPEPVELVLSPELPDLAITVTTPDRLPAARALVFLDLPGLPLRILTADADGRVAVPLPAPRPDRLRAAAHHGGSWVLGDWVGVEAATDDGIVLSLPAAGALLIRSEEASGRPTILAPRGWDLGALLAWLGTPPRVGPGAPLLLTGLPPGRYEVQLGEASTSVEVEAGETPEAEF